jgi:hypothetical protein
MRVLDGISGKTDAGWDVRMQKAKDPTQRLGLYNNTAEMLLGTAGTLVVILHISSRISHLPFRLYINRILKFEPMSTRKCKLPLTSCFPSGWLTSVVLHGQENGGYC